MQEEQRAPNKHYTALWTAKALTEFCTLEEEVWDVGEHGKLHSRVFTLNEQGSGFSPQYQKWGGHPIRSEHIWKLTYVNTNTGRRNSKLLIIVFLFFFLYPPPARNSWLLPLLYILVCPIGCAPQTHAISGKEKRKGEWEKKGPPSSLGTVSYELNPKSPAVHTGTFTSPHHFSHLLITACLNSLSVQWRHHNTYIKKVVPTM